MTGHLTDVSPGRIKVSAVSKDSQDATQNNKYI